MKFVFLTSGRFHVFDQVRELIKLGHDATVYTLVPPGRAEKFGIPRKQLVWIAPRIPFRMTVFMLFRKTGLSKFAYRMINEALDRKMSKVMPDCDAFISMSGMCIHSIRTARDKNILTILQRSSRHIESQAEILWAASGDEQVTKREIECELEEYEAADYITVLSQHTVDSFVEKGVPREKLFRLMPGVDLSCFGIRERAVESPPSIIYTGTWCMRKGCDLLVEAWQELKRMGWDSLCLTHVGNQGDLDYPGNDGFMHVERVDQSELPAYYSQAVVFCLPSREDGFGVVLLQALACGLRLVCSDKTGGADILEKLKDTDAVRVFRVGDGNELVDKLEDALNSARTTGHVDFLGTDHEKYSWKAHALSLAVFVRSHI